MCTCVRRVAGDDGALSDSARKAGNGRYRSWNVGGGGAAFPLGRAPPAAVGGHLASLKGKAGSMGGGAGGGAGAGRGRSRRGQEVARARPSCRHPAPVVLTKSKDGVSGQRAHGRSLQGGSSTE